MIRLMLEGVMSSKRIDIVELGRHQTHHLVGIKIASLANGFCAGANTLL